MDDVIHPIGTSIKEKVELITTQLYDNSRKIALVGAEGDDQ
jgi:hypothetical protein